MADGSVVIKVGVDTKNANNSVKLLKKTLEELGKTDAGKRLSNAIKDAGFSSEEVRKGFDNLKDAGEKAFSAVGSAAKVGAAAIGAGALSMTAAIAGVGKQALDSYAQYEQMVGGVDKLFGAGPAQSVEEYAQQVGKSADKVKGEYEKLVQASQMVKDNADAAFKTAGMSANAYMENVTGISAALINSLGGDTKKAAQMADVAMRAISDNVNTFGTDAQSVVDTYQSLARGQYAMLDNLKLGYGGTKEELKRLVDDANKYAATHKEAAEKIGVSNKLSADSYADVVAAIELVQEKQGIAGTTAREAATTIEGSVGMARAAWQNWVTELGKEDADLEGKTSDLVDSVVTAASNVIPRIGEIMANIGTAVADEIPHIGELVSEAMDDVELENGIATLLSGGADLSASISEMIQGTDFSQVANDVLTSIGDAVGSVDWGQAFATASQDIITAVSGIVEGTAQYIQDNGATIIAGIGSVILQVGVAVIAAIPTILTAIGSVLNAVIDAVLGFLANLASQAFTAAGQAAQSLVDGIVQGLADLASSVGEEVQGAVDSAKSFAGAMLGAGKELASNIGKGVDAAKGKVISAAKSAVNSARDGLSGIVSKFGEVGSNIIDGIKDGLISGASRLASAAREAAESALNAAKSFLGIHSPSRKFRDEVGVQITAGMAAGIEKGTGKVVKQAKKTSELTVSAFSKQLRKLEKKYGKSTAMTAAYWKKAGDKAKDGSALQAKCYAKMEAALKKYAESQDLGEQLKTYEKHAKVLKKVEAAQKKAVKATKDGTKANKAAQEALKQTQGNLSDTKKSVTDTKNAIKEAAKSAEEDFIGVEKASTKSLLEIKGNLEETIKSLNDAYQSAVESTRNSITNSLSIFKEFTSEGTGSAETLLANLRTQAQATGEYASNIEKLRERLKAKEGGLALFDEIADQGIKSLADLKTVNSMTEEQLDEYLELFEKTRQDATNAAKTRETDTYEKTLKGIEEAKTKALEDAQAAYDAYAKTLKSLGKKVSKAVKKQYDSDQKAIEELALTGTEKVEEIAARYAEVFGGDILDETQKYEKYTTSAMEAAAKATEGSVNKQQSVVKTGTTLITQTVKTAMDSQYAAVSGTMSAMEASVSATVANIASMMQQISSFEAAASAKQSATAAQLAAAKASASKGGKGGKGTAKHSAAFEVPAAASVDWYAAGGVFNTPQVIGIGEGGTEFALRDYHLDGIAERMGKAQQADISAAVGMLVRVLPQIIKESTPDSISINKREFGRLVREV